MVSPVNSGFAQQVPASNTFQPGGSSEQVQNKKNDEEQVRSTGTSTAQSQQSETRNNGSEEESSTIQTLASKSGALSNEDTQQRRGSVLDITV